jgi:multicomponent K+:H+ antiporter subunit E
VIRSNIAVSRIVIHRGARGQTAGFLEIPLRLRNPAGLAALACIITSTPGTTWAGYDSGSGVLTMHILDLVDEEAWVHTIQDRYERRLMEIFQ